MNNLRRLCSSKACPDLLASLRPGVAASYSSAVEGSLPSAATERATRVVELDVKDELHAEKVRRVLEQPVHPAASPFEASPSETKFQQELFRLHNSSMNVAGGHMIKARVLQVDKRKVTLDTGMKLAKIAVSDITPDCILERASAEAGGFPSADGGVRPGDIVQVYLEHEETPEGDMLVSGQQAAVRRRVRAVWRELQQRLIDGRPVKGRILNSVPGGFAIGVGGLVCFASNRSMTKATARRIGELQDFKVVQMNPARNNVVLEDNRLHLGLARATQGHMRPRQVRAEAEGFLAELGPKPSGGPTAGPSGLPAPSA